MNLNLAIAYVDQIFPAGTSVSGIQCSITGSASGATPVTQTVPDGTPTVMFPSVAADTYTYSVQALDQNGAGLGTAVTGTFVVTAPTTVTLSVPSTVSASQS